MNFHLLILLLVVQGTVYSFSYIPTQLQPFPTTINLPPNYTYSLNLFDYFRGDYLIFNSDYVEHLFSQNIFKLNTTGFFFRSIWKAQDQYGTWDLNLPNVYINNNNTVYYTYSSSASSIPDLKFANSFALPENFRCLDGISITNDVLIFQCTNHSIQYTLLGYDITKNITFSINVSPPYSGQFKGYKSPDGQNFIFRFQTRTNGGFEVFSYANDAINLVYNLSYVEYDGEIYETLSMDILNGVIGILGYNQDYPDGVLIILNPTDATFTNFESQIIPLPGSNYANSNIESGSVFGINLIQKNHSGNNFLVTTSDGTLFFFNFQDLDNVYISQSIIVIAGYEYTILGCSQNFIYLFDQFYGVLAIYNRNSNGASTLYIDFIVSDYQLILADSTLDYVFNYDTIQIYLTKYVKPLAIIDSSTNTTMELVLYTQGDIFDYTTDFSNSSNMIGFVGELGNSQADPISGEGIVSYPYVITNFTGTITTSPEILEHSIINTSMININPSLKAGEPVFSLVQNLAEGSSSFYILTQYETDSAQLSLCKSNIFNTINVSISCNSQDITTSNQITQAALGISSSLIVAILFDGSANLTFFDGSFAQITTIVESCTSLLSSPPRIQSLFYCSNQDSISVYYLNSTSQLQTILIDETLLGLGSFNPSIVKVAIDYPDFFFVLANDVIYLINVVALPDKKAITSTISAPALQDFIITDTKMILFFKNNSVIFYSIESTFYPTQYIPSNQIEANTQMGTSGVELFYSFISGSIQVYSTLLPDLSYLYTTLSIQFDSIIGLVPTTIGDILLYTSSSMIQASLVYYKPSIKYKLNMSAFEGEVGKANLTLSLGGITSSSKIYVLTNKTKTELLSNSLSVQLPDIKDIVSLSDILHGPIQGYVNIEPEFSEDLDNLEIIQPIDYVVTLELSFQDNEEIIDGFQQGNTYNFLTWNQSAYQLVTGELFFTTVSDLTRTQLVFPTGDSNDWDCQKYFAVNIYTVAWCTQVSTGTQYLISDGGNVELIFEEVISYYRGHVLIFLGKVGDSYQLQFILDDFGLISTNVMLPLSGDTKIIGFDLGSFSGTNSIILLDSQGMLYYYGILINNNPYLYSQTMAQLYPNTSSTVSFDLNLPLTDFKILNFTGSYSQTEISFLVYQQGGIFYNVHWKLSEAKLVYYQFNPYPHYTVSFEDLQTDGSTWFLMKTSPISGAGLDMLVFYSLENEGIYKDAIGAFESNGLIASGSELYYSLLKNNSSGYSLIGYNYNGPAIFLSNFGGNSSLKSSYVNISLTGANGASFTAQVKILPPQDEDQTGLIILIVAGSLLGAGIVGFIIYKIWKKKKGYVKLLPENV